MMMTMNPQRACVSRSNSQRGGIIFTLLSLLFLIALIAIIYVARHPLLRLAGSFWVVDEAPESSDVIAMLGDDNYNGDRAARVADKMPDNYMYLGLMAAVFPRATFIHCRRDPRDIAVSCWMTDFRSIRWANDLEHIASRFQQYRRLMEHWQAVLPATIHHVDYEETVANTEAVARRLVAACGLDWEPACLEFHTNERPIRTASVTQVRQPVYKRSVARWKNYEASLGELFANLPVGESAPIEIAAGRTD